MPEKTFRIYSDHKGSSLELPKCTLQAAQKLAQAAADLQHDTLYRLFSEETPGRFQFETAFSVLAGQVREHRDVTIPKEHW